MPWLLALWWACGGGAPPSGGPPEVPEAARDVPDLAAYEPDERLPVRACQGRKGPPGCFVALAGGTFLMGAQATDPDAPGYDPAAAADEAPPHRVTVSPLWVQAHEVRAVDVARCLDLGVCRADDVLTEGGFATVASGAPAGMPATGVSWHGAARYCAFLGGRLPSEAEWAFAARGTEGRRFPWGDALRCPHRGATTAPVTPDRLAPACAPVVAALHDQLGEQDLREVVSKLEGRLDEAAQARWCGEVADLPGDVLVAKAREVTAVGAGGFVGTPAPRTSCVYDGPVAAQDQQDATPEGLTGLAGGLWEWTADRYGAYPRAAVRDPRGPASGAQRVQRGGSWMAEDLAGVRAALRAAVPPEAQLPDVGFRCVRDDPPDDPPP